MTGERRCPSGHGRLARSCGVPLVPGRMNTAPPLVSLSPPPNTPVSPSQRPTPCTTPASTPHEGGRVARHTRPCPLPPPSLSSDESPLPCTHTTLVSVLTVKTMSVYTRALSPCPLNRSNVVEFHPNALPIASVLLIIMLTPARREGSPYVLIGRGLLSPLCLLIVRLISVSTSLHVERPLRLTVRAELGEGLRPSLDVIRPVEHHLLCVCGAHACVVRT